jgi:hypothetical protein
VGSKKYEPMECLPSETEEELVSRFVKSREFQFTHNALIADIRILFEALTLAADEQKPFLIRFYQCALKRI